VETIAKGDKMMNNDQKRAASEEKVRYVEELAPAEES
jgi:hypothetical protein